MDKHVCDRPLNDMRIERISLYLADLIDAKDLPVKNVVLQELIEDMTYVLRWTPIEEDDLYPRD
jgi:hypothetical protein